jgi:hypothetical protein
VVAKVDEVLPPGERILAHLSERDHGLDAAAIARLQRREAELAGVARVHDAAGDTDVLAARLVDPEAHEAVAHLGNRRCDRQSHGVRTEAEVVGCRDQPLALGESHGLLLGDLLGGRLDYGIRVCLGHRSLSVGGKRACTSLLVRGWAVRRWLRSLSRPRRTRCR